MTKKRKSPTIAETIRKFYDYKKPSLRANSVLVLENSMKAIEKCCDLDFNTAPITALDKHVLRGAFTTYANGTDRHPVKERAKTTVHRRHQDWREFFHFLLIDGYLDGLEDKTPMATVNIAKPDKNLPKPLPGWDEDAIPRLIAAVRDGSRKSKDPWPERDIAIISTMLATGTRASEVCDMNINALEGRAPEFFIRIVRGKGGKMRIVPVEEEIDVILGVYLESRKARFPKWKQKSDDPMWLGARNEDGTKRMTRWQLDWLLESSLKAAGLRRPDGAVAHMFRHTYGTILAARKEDGTPGMNVRSLARLMGHESINTTMGYIESSGREEREGAAKNAVYDAMRQAFKTEE